MTISRESKTLIRNTIFRHLDGIAITSTIHCLHKSKILKYISVNKKCDLQTINKQWNGNIGYLNIALRLLSSQGWLNRRTLKEENNFDISLTERGFRLIQYCTLYTNFMPWYHYVIKTEYPFINEISSGDYNFINDYLNSAENNWGFSLSNTEDLSSLEFQILKHLNGVLIGPVVVSLGRMGILKDYDSLLKFIKSNKVGYLIGRILALESWIDISNNNIKITAQGKYAFSLSTAYGVTASYIQTFINVEELLFGNPTIVLQKTKSGKETHVNRTMNVWGSGGAHKTYFNTIDDIIIETFNQPIERQPSGIADMGCGDGTFLRHIYKVITTSTLRRKHIKHYPLYIIGADYNHAARNATRNTLSTANIPHCVVYGNIGDPKTFARDINNEYNIKLKNMLNVRSFLDHNRIYSTPNIDKKHCKSNSTGAFAFKGELISNAELEQNLIEHFLKWKPYIETHGLLLLELHTIPPLLASENIGLTTATAYDTTHGYTDQYILELDIMLNCAKKAGLYAENKFQRKYPDGDLTTISINLLKSRK